VLDEVAVVDILEVHKEVEDNPVVADKAVVEDIAI
jgi:hypothetical protein